MQWQQTHCGACWCGTVLVGIVFKAKAPCQIHVGDQVLRGRAKTMSEVRLWEDSGQVQHFRIELKSAEHNATHILEPLNSVTICRLILEVAVKY